MRRVVSMWTIAVCACALVAGPAWGQTTAPASPDDATNAGKAKVGEKTGQPKPEELLRQMADYLNAMPAFSCLIDWKIVIQAHGMERTKETTVIVRLERPNHLALIVETGREGITTVSNGKDLTQYVRALNRYLVSAAPSDLSELRQEGALVGWAGTILPSSGEEFYKSLVSGVTSSEYVGTDKVGDVECHHLKFLQEDFNWEIWIEVGELPLPLKVSAQYAAREDTKLEYIVTFSDWNVAPKFTDGDFKFVPPEGAEKVNSLFEGLAVVDEGPHPLLGQPAPPFKTVGLDEKPIDFSAHLGKNVVMLDFWATWCGPCVQAMPQIDGVAKKFADRGLVFYAVNAGEDVETIQEFLKTSELDVPVAMDADGNISQLYKANAIPQTVLIGKDGKVQVVHVGFGNGLAELLSSQIEDLLAGKDLVAAAKSTGESSETATDTGTTTDAPVGKGVSD